VNVSLRPRQGGISCHNRVVMSAWACFIVLSLQPAEGETPSGRARRPVPQGKVASAADSVRAGSLQVIEDVALRPGGVLEGRVVHGEGLRLRETVAGLPVTLFEGGTIVARTKTDAQGRFRIGSMRGGFYRVTIDAANGPSSRFFRLWTSSGAPPHAGNEATVSVGQRLLLGQSPFPGTGFSREAAITAIVAGAIAVPIIYQSVKRDDHIPASP